jgi:integrase
MNLQANVAGKRGKSGKAKTVGTVLAQGVAGESHREKEPRYTPDSGAGAVAYLFLRRLPSGRQNWVVIRRMAGAASPVTVTIGRKDSMSLRDARRAAEIVNGQMARGENPNATKKAARAAEHAKVAAKRAATVHTLLAVGRAFIQHCEVGTRQHGPRAPATVAEYRRKLQNDIPEKWHPRPLAGISADEVKGLIGTMGERAPVAANRLFEFLSATFNYAVSRKILPANPLKGLPRDDVLFREKSRRRSLVHHLTGDLSEVVALWRGIETIEPEHHPFRALVKMLLLTGARVGTFARAHPEQTDAILWRHVKDLHKPEHARIEVPASLRKTGDDGDEGYTIALSPAAVAVLDGLAKVSDSAPVFTMDGKMPLKIDHPQRDQVRALANKAAGRKLEHFTLHDLRRTVSTGLGHLGCPKPVQDAILDHRERGIAAIYNRAQLFGPSKEWLTRWAENLTAAVGRAEG